MRTDQSVLCVRHRQKYFIAYGFSVRIRSFARLQDLEFGNCHTALGEPSYPAVLVFTSLFVHCRVSNIALGGLERSAMTMGARILSADDNDDNEVARGRLRELLKSRDGWEACAEAENGQQAVLKATDGGFPPS